MSEMKRNFSGGKMNKDLDERLVKPGEYRDANNIEVSTSEGSNVGSVQSVMGNTERTDGVISATPLSAMGDESDRNPICVGVIADEKNNKIYSLIHNPRKFYIGSSVEDTQHGFVNQDFILEYNTDDDTHKYVFVDNYQVFVTVSAQCNSGQAYLTFSDNKYIRNGMKVSWNIAGQVTQHATVLDTFTNGTTNYSSTVVKLDSDLAFNIPVNTQIVFNFERALHFTPFNKITAINIIDDLLFWTDNWTEPKKVNITRGIAGTGGATALPPSNTTNNNGTNTDFQTRLYGEFNPLMLIRCKYESDESKPIWCGLDEITVIRKAPKTPPTLRMSSEKLGRRNTTTGIVNNTSSTYTGVHQVGGTNIVAGDTITITVDTACDWRVGDVVLVTDEQPTDPSNFTDFLIRYEVTAGVGNPNNLLTNFTFTVLAISTTSTLSGSSEQYWFNLERPEAMFITKFPRFAYRYKYTDGEYSPFSPWSQPAFLMEGFDYEPKKGYNLGMVNNLRQLFIKDYLVERGAIPEDIVEVDILYKEDSSPTVYTVKTLSRSDFTVAAPGNLIFPNLQTNPAARGELEITSEMIHAVVPSNQMLRPWDNVPRKALAQEVTGNRIVYGNYVQNYDLKYAGREIKPEFNIDFWNYALPSDGQSPAKSVKSLRNYQVGIVYCDRFGRETPVLTDKKSGSIYLEKSYAPRENRIRIQNLHNAPSWATHYKYYIKETSNEYYNLAMDRWYNAEDGNIWISFPSAERNKVDIDTYLILKKKHGTSQPVTDKARYKILAISPDAPDFIKINRMGLGTAPSSGFQSSGYPLPDLTYVYVLQSTLDSAFGVSNGENDLQKFAMDGELFFRSVVGDDASDWYQVVKISLVVPDSNNTSLNYYDIKIDGKFGTDMDITSTANSFASAVAHQMEFRREIVENRPEFDGKFFVKIYRDLVLEENVLGAQPASQYSVNMSRRIYHAKSHIDFSQSLQVDDGYNPPDNYIYWNGDATQENTTGSGGYIGTPYDTSMLGSSYSTQETSSEGWFKDQNGKWFIDNEMAAKGGAGRGIHRDQQGYSYGGDRVNDGSRVQGSGDKTGANGRSGTGNAVAGTDPADLYRGGTGINLAHNVMHLSKFGIRKTGSSGEPTSFDIEGNPDEQDDWGWAQLCDTVGAKFRWREDPDKQVYEIIRTEKQIEIKNYSTSGNSEHYTSNRRVRWSLKFQPLNNPGFGFGDTTTHRFHPTINAVDETGAAVVVQGQSSVGRPYNFAGLDDWANNYLTMEFLDIFDPSEDETKEYVSNPAIWETEPKEDVGLDIYYEMGPTYPMNITADTNEMLAPVGSWFFKGGVKYFIESWSTTTMHFHQEEVPSGAATTTLSFADLETVAIYTTYGGLVYVAVDGAQNNVDNVLLHGGSGGTYQQHGQRTIPAWWNCISFGNGVESDRVRDGFNLTKLVNGVKASSTVATPYREERRKSGLIYSGIYNSTSGVNDTNQFIAAEKITKDLNPDYGSIQKLYTRETNLLTFCEDKVLKIQANKDALFNADGSSNVTASANVLGQAIPIMGDYGISTNPESFAAYATNCYFVDSQRGSVMQMKGDAMAPISQVGMSDYFSDLLKNSFLHRCIGSYDEKKSNYNLYINTKNKRIKNAGLYTSQTITYSEKSKGWSSFKTFYPEQGLSLNNRYFTWKDGSMWEHHSNNTHCSFYGATPNSSSFASVDIMFNDMPTAVKSYNTMNYEGTQAKIDQFITQAIDGVTYDDGEYYNLTAKTGWHCDSIVSDLQEGEVPEFLNKEGKWFNAIYGVETSLSNLDEREFTTQGIGYATVGISAQAGGLAGEKIAIATTLSLSGAGVNQVEPDQLIKGNNITVGDNINTVTHVFTFSSAAGFEDAATIDNTVTITGASPSADDANSRTYTSNLPAGIAQVVITNTNPLNSGYTVTVTFSSATPNDDTSFTLPLVIASADLVDVPISADLARVNDNRFSTRLDTSRTAQTAFANSTVTYTENAVTGTTYGSALTSIPNMTSRRVSRTVVPGVETLVFDVTIAAGSNKYIEGVEANLFNYLPESFVDRRAEQNTIVEAETGDWNFVTSPAVTNSSGLVTSWRVYGYYTAPAYGDPYHTNDDGTVMTVDEFAAQNPIVIGLKYEEQAITGAVTDEITGFSVDKTLDKKGGRMTISVTGNQSTAGCKINVQRSSDNHYYNFATNAFQSGAADKDVTVGTSLVSTCYVNYGAASSDITYTIWLTQNAGGDTIKSGLPISSSKRSIIQKGDMNITLAPTTSAGDFGSMPAVSTYAVTPRIIKTTKRPTSSDSTKYYDYSDANGKFYNLYNDGYVYHEFNFIITPSTSRVISILVDPNLHLNNYKLIKSADFNATTNGGTEVDLEINKVINEGNNARIYGYFKIGDVSKFTSPLALTFNIDSLIT
tara:strand:+ start:8743 stop:15921 length:7179 start_codon:yes stop_codon:yes gene_type:complete